MVIDVMKIGGAVLRKSNGFDALLNIITNHCQNLTIFVFSAFSDFSSRLKSIAKLAPRADFQQTKSQLNELRKEANDIIKSILTHSNIVTDCLEKLNELFNEIEKILFGVSVTRELTPRILDKILSYGEYISAIILEKFFTQNKINAKIVDAGELIVTDQNFGNANPIYSITAERVSKIVPSLFDLYDFIFLQGFIGKSQNGYQTTMGFESSNLTALLIAEIVSANKVIFWTDVEGIRTADPKLVENTMLIEEMSIIEAKRSSDNGLKLIHPKMIEYFGKCYKTNFYYYSAFSPNGGKTKIVPFENSKKLPLIISNIIDGFDLHHFISNTHLSSLTKTDNNFFHSVESQSFKEDNLGLVTILNSKISVVLSFLSNISIHYRYIFVDHNENLVRVLIDSADIKEFSNEIHRELVQQI